MDNKLLKEFYDDISTYWRTKHTWSKGLVSFRPDKKDSDIVILQRVLKKAVKINPENKQAETRLKEFENFLVINIAKKGSNRFYISKDSIDLTDDAIIGLCKFNKEFTKDLEIQEENNKQESLGMGA